MESVPQDLSDLELVYLARNAMKNAHCPYSKFPVGAVVVTEDGTFIMGCNVENASYGGTICAERSAICSAVSQGYTKFKAIAIATELAEPASPCGLCRQFLIEFGNYKVVIGTAQNSKLLITNTFDLLPNAFTPDSLAVFERQEKAVETTEEENSLKVSS